MESIDSYPVEAFENVYRLNVFGYFSLTQKLLPLLEKAGSPSYPSRVINISSIDGVAVHDAEAYAYSSSKAAVNHLTKIMAGRLAERNITVNAILPGVFPSSMSDPLLAGEGAKETVIGHTPLRRLGMAEDIAGVSLFLVSKAGNYMTGTLIPVDGGKLINKVEL